MLYDVLTLTIFFQDELDEDDERLRVDISDALESILDVEENYDNILKENILQDQEVPEQRRPIPHSTQVPEVSHSLNDRLNVEVIVEEEILNDEEALIEDQDGETVAEEIVEELEEEEEEKPEKPQRIKNVKGL